MLHLITIAKYSIKNEHNKYGEKTTTEIYVNFTSNITTVVGLV